MINEKKTKEKKIFIEKFSMDYLPLVKDGESIHSILDMIFDLFEREPLFSKDFIKVGGGYLEENKPLNARGKKVCRFFDAGFKKNNVSLSYIDGLKSKAFEAISQFKIKTAKKGGFWSFFRAG